TGPFVYGLAISANGRFVAFTSEASNLVPGDTNQHEDVFVHDRLAGTTQLVSVSSSGQQGNGDSGSVGGVEGGVAISADGRFVGFESNASNLVANDTNGETDIFIHDRKTGLTERLGTGVSDLPNNGEVPPVAFSTDDRYAAFVAEASNLTSTRNHY